MTDDSNKKPSKAYRTQRTVAKIVADADVWVDQFGDTYATFRVHNPSFHVEHWPLASKEARAQFTADLVDAGASCSRPALDELIQRLETKAILNKLKKETHLRVGHHGDSYYLNLMDDAWRAVRINAQDWQIVPNPPIIFVRSGTAKPLSPPVKSGSLAMIDELIRVQHTPDRHMIVSWLLNALFPTGAYPILLLTGEQGSAKSTTSKLLRGLIDPAKPLMRPLQKDDRNLMIEATHNWVLCYDNLSTITPAHSDSLCRLAVGAGFGVRSHYENKAETTFDAARPLILNGIGSVVNRLDLLDRCIRVKLAPISSTERKTEAELYQRAKELQPYILGALLDLFSKCLANLPHTTPRELPRMADFAKRVLAVETEIGWEAGEFLSYYANIIQNAENEATVGDSFITSIMQFMQGKESWSGTPTELHTNLLALVPEEHRDQFPKSNKMPFDRVAPVLRKHGIEYDTGQRAANARSIILRNKNPNFLIAALETIHDE